MPGREEDRRGDIAVRAEDPLHRKISFTPATTAGTAAIRTDEGRGARAAATCRPARVRANRRPTDSLHGRVLERLRRAQSVKPQEIVEGGAERILLLLLESALGRFDLRRGDFDRVELDLVEFLGVGPERGIAVVAHVRDDGPDGFHHVIGERAGTAEGGLAGGGVQIGETTDRDHDSEYSNQRLDSVSASTASAVARSGSFSSIASEGFIHDPSARWRWART
jgi:hypothetical protein